MALTESTGIAKRNGGSREHSRALKLSRAVVIMLLLGGPTPRTAAAQVSGNRGEARIIDNARPALSPAQALKLAAPSLVIGTQPDPRYEFSDVAGAIRLSDGRLVVADGGSLQLRFYDGAGSFLHSSGSRGEGPGEFRRMDGLQRLPGDTLVVLSFPGTISFFTAAGQFVRRVHAGAVPVDLAGRIRFVAATLAGGSMVLGSIPSPRSMPRDARWVDSVSLVLVAPDSTVRQRLGGFPWMLMHMDESGPRPPWFGAGAAFASNGTSFFVGYGGNYEFRIFSSDGRLERIVRRRWTPTRVTRTDIDQYVRDWSRRWLRSTGAEAEQERRDLRDDPYAETVPAFSQFVADVRGRLWVREPHLQDAPAAGQLNTSPLIPSVWSVFDANGRWLCDVMMPARFMPTDIGTDYVLGIAQDRDGVETVVQYRLGS